MDVFADLHQGLYHKQIVIFLSTEAEHIVESVIAKLPNFKFPFSYLNNETQNKMALTMAAEVAARLVAPEVSRRS